MDRREQLLRPLVDFTFDRTEGEEHHVLREDFSYRTETLVMPAEKHGLAARFMADWEEVPHGQSKIRVTRRDAPCPVPGSTVMLDLDEPTARSTERT